MAGEIKAKDSQLALKDRALYEKTAEIERLNLESKQASQKASAVVKEREL